MRRTAALLIAASFTVTSCSAGRPAADSTASRAGHTPAALTWARRGDTVLVVTNHIRADRRAQFEEAITSFWNAGSRAGALDSTGTATFAHTRVLYPVAPDSDGTYAYLFIMDPYITGANYSIDSLLKRLFPAADAARLNQAIEGAMASPQVSRRVVQHIP